MGKSSLEGTARVKKSDLTSKHLFGQRSTSACIGFVVPLLAFPLFCGPLSFLLPAFMRSVWVYLVIMFAISGALIGIKWPDRALQNGFWVSLPYCLLFLGLMILTRNTQSELQQLILATLIVIGTATGVAYCAARVQRFIFSTDADPSQSDWT